MARPWSEIKAESAAHRRVREFGARVYGAGEYRVAVEAHEASLVRPDGEVVCAAHALDGDHLGALERLLERRAERLS